MHFLGQINLIDCRVRFGFLSSFLFLAPIYRNVQLTLCASVHIVNGTNGTLGNRYSVRNNERICALSLSLSLSPSVCAHYKCAVHGRLRWDTLISQLISFGPIWFRSEPTVCTRRTHFTNEGNQHLDTTIVACVCVCVQWSIGYSHHCVCVCVCVFNSIYAFTYE